MIRSSCPGLAHGCPVQVWAVKAESKQGLGIIELGCEYFMGAPECVFVAYLLQYEPVVVGEFDLVTTEKASLNNVRSPPIRVLRRAHNRFRSTGQPWALPGYPSFSRTMDTRVKPAYDDRVF